MLTSWSLQNAPVVFFFNDTPTTEIYCLPLHDALPISDDVQTLLARLTAVVLNWDEPDLTIRCVEALDAADRQVRLRSEEHTSELQSQSNLVCRLLLENKTQPRYSRPPT